MIKEEIINKINKLKKISPNVNVELEKVTGIIKNINKLYSDGTWCYEVVYNIDYFDDGDKYFTYYTFETSLNLLNKKDLI